MRLLRLTFFLLATLLVFTSQARFTHDLSHLFDAQHHSAQVCDICLAFTGQEGASLPVLPVIPAKPQAIAAISRPLHTTEQAAFFAVFLARAPPFFLC